MSDRPNNAFLRGLDRHGFDDLAEGLKLVELSHARNLSYVGDPVEWVYFPETALLSLIASDRGGQGVETTMVGNEGAAMLTEACGSGRHSVNCVVQVDGQAWRAPAAHCRTLVASDAGFNASAWRIAELQMAESRQSGLCQAMHTVEARFSRWLLESVDRSAGRNPLPLTQEFVAAMLGVQRTTVSAFASQLQKEGLITYSRGQINIVDEAALEKRACECRQVTKAERIRLGFAIERH